MSQLISANVPSMAVMVLVVGCLHTALASAVDTAVALVLPADNIAPTDSETEVVDPVTSVCLDGSVDLKMIGKLAQNVPIYCNDRMLVQQLGIRR